MLEWAAPFPDSPVAELQGRPSIPETAPNFPISASVDSAATSLASKSQRTNSLPAITDGIPGIVVEAVSVAPGQATSGTQDAAEEARLETTNHRALTTIRSISPVHEEPLDDAHSATEDRRQANPSQSSKHGKIEKYFCEHSDCSRSHPGSGFHRRDHLVQHLRGLHKQSSVARIRAKPATLSSSPNPITTSQVSDSPSQFKKRKREGHGDSDAHSRDELAEERKKRLTAEQENQELRQEIQHLLQKLAKCEEQKEKAEERREKAEERREKAEERREKYEERMENMRNGRIG